MVKKRKMSAATSEEEIVDKNGTVSSPVWEFFGFYKSGRNQTNVVCKLCKNVVPTKSGNTTNLFYHLSRAHALEHSRIKQPRPIQQKQQTTTERYSTSVPYDKSSKCHKDITEAVAYYIAKDMLPLSTVEKPGFKNLLHVLDPRYVLPGRKYFSKTAITKLYLKCKESVQQEILSAKYFATTSDLWSSRTSEPYISLTIHFIDEEWNLRTRCLETADFPDDHTGEVIAEGLKEVLLSWSLTEHKMVCITTDSGANMVKATSLNHWTRLQCFGHRLHSAIGAAGKDRRVDRAVGGSRQKTVARAPVLESMNAALTPLLEFTDSLSGESYVTVSYVKPMLHLFRSNLLQVNEGDTQLTKEMKTKIMAYLDENYAGPDSDDLLDMATLMDPRFKVQYIRPEKVVATKMRAVSEVVNEGQGQSQAGPSEGAADQGAEGGAAAAAAATPPLPLGVKKQRKSLGSFFKKQSQEEVDLPLTDEKKVESELERYLRCPDADSGSEPLDWWRLNEHNFPRLSQLAKKYLCIPATSTPSERIFSTGGNIVTCTRAALKPEKVNQLVFLSENIHG
ncbi:E3 SUMO-protein ligase ZBED1-like [Trachinotus anak]|uniref:E3 SUMO-protein ligase ZBED1-like n=1 Tax=Trachinotus anak TaxID=443729 RepID=UPI0039F20F2F